MRSRRVITADHGLTVVDRGTTGLAMLARPVCYETIEDDVHGEDGTRRFERTEVLRVRDGVLDHYARIGVLAGFALEAAIMLAQLYEAGRNAPTGWRSGGAGNGEMSDERAAAWADYCRALDHLPRKCEPSCADIARGRFPAGMHAVGHMKEGFETLVKYFRLGPRAA